MSNAEPMGDQRRRASYGVTGNRRWPTPRQARRMRHKQRKGKYGYGYPDTKGYATWPRAEVRAAVLANRRRAEADRG